MASFNKILNSSSFTPSDDGYVATILATDHNLGTTVHMDKLLKYVAGTGYCNVVESYCVLSNGDVEIYVDEVGAYLTTISN